MPSTATTPASRPPLHVGSFASRYTRSTSAERDLAAIESNRTTSNRGIESIHTPGHRLSSLFDPQERSLGSQESLLFVLPSRQPQAFTFRSPWGLTRFRMSFMLNNEHPARAAATAFLVQPRFPSQGLYYVYMNFRSTSATLPPVQISLQEFSLKYGQNQTRYSA